MHIEGANRIHGLIEIPADKSISHRSAMIGSLTGQTVRIKNFLFAKDCLHTIKVLKKLGVEIKTGQNTVTVKGCGPAGLIEPQDVLYVGNSGTTLRLMAGILAGSRFMSVLAGDSSINRRPMARIIEPLASMGATIYARGNNTLPPMAIIGAGKLKGKTFHIPVASAQVKSCLTLAGINAAGRTEIIQPAVSRDHTERMLQYFGADISFDGQHTCINPSTLTGKDLFVPGDISSAAYFMVACLILKDSHIQLKDIGLNPTRSHFLQILQDMGANIEITNQRMLNNEPVADLQCHSSQLHAATIDKQFIPNIIDEIPVLCVAFAKARGTTVIEGAKELRHKESDRIEAIYTQFSKLGVRIGQRQDGLVIEGCPDLAANAVSVDSFGDHRMAMSCAILALLGNGKTFIRDADCIDTSFPQFFNLLKKHVR